MSNDVRELQRLVCDLVALASGLPADQIMIYRGGPHHELAGTYCSVYLTNDRIIGVPSPHYSDSGTQHVLDEKVHVATEFTLSLHFFRDGANQFANNMKGARFLDAVKRFCYQNGLGWMNFGPINNLTGLFSGQVEERAAANLQLLADGYTTNQVNQALAVDVELLGDWVPSVGELYAIDPQAGDEFTAWDNNPS